MPSLQHSAEAAAGRLLRLLLVWNCCVSADPGRRFLLRRLGSSTIFLNPQPDIHQKQFLARQGRRPRFLDSRMTFRQCRL